MVAIGDRARSTDGKSSYFSRSSTVSIQDWKKPYLFDILYFLEIFQSKGIEQKHFRYFLMKSHNLEFDSGMDIFYNQNKAAFKVFAPHGKNLRTHMDVCQLLEKFGKIKDEVEKEKQIKELILSVWRRGSIKTVGDLDQYLRRLRKNRIITKANRKKPLQYVTTVEYEKNYRELRILEFIERWDIKDKAEVAPAKFKGHRYDTSIFGASGEEFTKEDTNKIGEYLRVICDNLAKILELKKQKTHPLLDGVNESDKAKLTSIDFFYHGSLL